MNYDEIKPIIDTFEGACSRIKMPLKDEQITILCGILAFYLQDAEKKIIEKRRGGKTIPVDINTL